MTTDYDAIRRTLSLDPTLAHAITFAPGIRILRQDPWEALCCFIISQNNNIKRIKGIVQRLCSCLGEPIPSSDCFSFPSSQRLAAATLEELEPLRCGFRAKYLLDAARRVSSGQVQLDAIPQMPLEQARAHLMQIVGVGPKIADCALLYGFHRLECCPMDVWMKRVFAALYPNGLPDCAQDFIGIAQQYLFHYARCCPQILEPFRRRPPPNLPPPLHQRLKPPMKSPTNCPTTTSPNQPQAHSRPMLLCSCVLTCRFRHCRRILPQHWSLTGRASLPSTT